MKILILSVSAGEGHNAMSRAVKAAAGDAEVTVYDLFKDKNKLRSKTVNDTYFNFSRKHLKTSNAFYESLKKPEPKKHTSFLVNSFIAPAKKHTLAFIRKEKPDVIFTAHLYAAVMMSQFRDAGLIDIPVVSVVSDYDLSPFIECGLNIDGIVSPDPFFTKGLIDKGFSPEQIHCLGIPVQPKFSVKKDKLACRELLGVRPDLFTIMMMNGGVGFGNSLALLQSLLKAKGDYQIIVINGRNEQMKADIDAYIAENGITNVKNIGFADNVDVIMSASDLLIGKIGGVAIAEAFNKNLPILASTFLPWQEYDNMVWLTARNACAYIDNPDEAYKHIEIFLQHPERLAAMQNAMARIAKPNASSDIAALLKELALNHEV